MLVIQRTPDICQEFFLRSPMLAVWRISGAIPDNNTAYTLNYLVIPVFIEYQPI
jgi:hypothetical protein